MRIKLIIVALLILPLLASSQTSQHRPTIIMIVKPSPNAKEVVTNHAVIGTGSIAHLYQLTNKEIKTKLGKRIDTPMVFRITLKLGFKLYTLSEFYMRHKITGKAQEASFVIDGETIRDTTKLLIDESIVKSVEAKQDSIVVKTTYFIPGKSSYW